MKWTTATALFLAVAAGGVGVTAVLNREPKAPADVLAEVQRDMKGPSFDTEGALKQLSRALDDERLDKQPELEMLLRRQRAELSRRLGLFKDARSDLSTRLDGQPDPTRETRLEVIELMTLEGNSADALNEVKPLVMEEPDFGEARAMQAKLLVDSALEGLDVAFATAGARLASSETAEAEAIISELAARVPDDPRRLALTTRLRETLSNSRELAMAEIIDQINLPRLQFKNARLDYAKALELIPRPEFVVAMGDLLERAGQIELSLQLHRAARNLPEVSTDAAAMGAFLRQLLSANRIPEAVAALRRWKFSDGGTLKFYQSAGEVFFRAGEYTALSPVAQGLSRTHGDIGRAWARFFAPVASIASEKNRKPAQIAKLGPVARTKRVERIEGFVASLKAFADEEANPEPFFGARKAALFWIAEAHGLLGDKVRERKALDDALKAATNPTADDWIRLSQLYKETSDNIPWEEVERALTEAMNIDPSRTAELSSEWFSAGLERLKKRNETVDGLVARLERAGFSALDSASIGPSVMTQIAGKEFALGNFFKAKRAAEAARDKYRNLIPPLDILIRVKLANKQRAPKEEIIERIESAGLDPQVEGFMSQLDGGRLDDAELVRAIRAAPERFGKAAVARYYLTLDDAAKAGDSLVGIKDATAPPELKLLRGQLLVEDERFEQALEELEGLEREPVLRRDALLLRLESLIGLGRLAQLDPVAIQLGRLSGATDDEKKLVLDAKLTAIDRLASCGRVDLALMSLEALDQRPETRTAGFYRRKLLIDALTLKERGPVPTQETILRAEPYLEDGTAEITAIALAVSQRDWTELPMLVDRLLESNFQASPKQEAALELLGERLQGGTRAATEGLASSPRDAEWAFLSCAAAMLVDGRVSLPQWFGPTAARDAAVLLRGGSARALKDPRDALVVYLMSSRPEWSPWVLPRIKELRDDTRSTLWTTWLQARVQASVGDQAGSARSIAQLTELHPLFGPGHDSAVTLAKRAHPTEPLHRQIARARRIRLQSLGEELIGNQVEIRLARAGELARKGNHIEAIQELTPVVNSGGIDAAEGRLMLGLLMIHSEQYSVAAVQLEDALKQDAGIFEESAILSLLFALQKAMDNQRAKTPVAQRSPLSEDDVLSMLARLSEKFPDDPMIALADLKLSAPEVETEQGIQSVRAKTTLDRLYLESERKTLDQLRRGSTRPWIEYLLPIAPELAEEILARDLVKEPGNLDIWQLSGEVAEAQNKFKEAKGFYETLQRINPRPETAFSLAEIMIREGEEIRAARNLLTLASKQLGGGSEKPMYLRTVADLRDRRIVSYGEKKFDEITPRLKSLWSARRRIEKDVDPTDLGLLYADALFRQLTDIRVLAERRLSGVLGRRRARRATAEEKNQPYDPDSDVNLSDEEELAEKGAVAEAEYRAVLAELLALAPELVTEIESDMDALYELDLATAMSGLAKHIAAQGFKAPLTPRQMNNQ